MSIDWLHFHGNRSRFPVTELAKYGGSWVAWSSDGSNIVASSADSEAAVYAILESRGYDPADHCISYVEGPDDVFVGPVIWSRCTAEQKAELFPHK